MKIKRKLVDILDETKEKRQEKALERLKSLYEQYPIKPLRYGFTQQSLNNANVYDIPGFQRNWIEDKRKTTIPNYEVKDESQGTTED